MGLTPPPEYCANTRETMAGFSFIHAADLHLGSPMEALSKYEGCPEDRIRGAVQKALERMVDLAIREEVAFVLLAGDIFDRKPKDIQPGLHFNNQIRRLKEKGIRTFAIAGNHDAESSTWRNVPRAEVEYLPDDKPGTVQLEANGIPVAIHGHSYSKPVVRANLAAKYPAAEMAHFNIGLLHTSLDNPESAHKTYAPCSLQDLIQMDYDYWALGHIHKPEVLNEFPHILYPGNLQGRSVRELGPRGCYLVKVDPNKKVTSCSMQRLDQACWLEREIDVSDIPSLPNIEESIAEAFQSAQEEAGESLAIVRLLLKGQTPLSPALHRDAEDLRTDWLDLANEQGVWLEKVKVLTTTPQAPTSKAAPNLPSELLQDLQTATPPTEDEFLGLDPISKLLSRIPRDIKASVKSELLGNLQETTSAAQTTLESHLFHQGEDQP